MNRLFLTLTTATAIALVQPAVAQEREEVSNYASVYYGDRTQVVTVVPIKEKKAAYVKVSGVDHPINDRVFRAVTVSAGIQGKNYTIEYEGEEKTIFLTRKPYNRGEIAELYLPGMGKDTNLVYDRSLSSQMPPLHIQTEYLQQQEKE